MGKPMTQILSSFAGFPFQKTISPPTSTFRESLSASLVLLRTAISMRCLESPLAINAACLSGPDVLSLSIRVYMFHDSMVKALVFLIE